MDITKSDSKSVQTSQQSLVYQLWFPMLLFASIGAITWAIRGTGGWGGIDGTILPAFTWGILWYYLSAKNGIDARHVVLWLGLGLSLGGELGYGQYVSWIQGHFSIGDEVLPLNPALGYFWFIMCGIGWAAPGGIVLGWVLSDKVSVKTWISRAVLLLALFVVLFAWPILDSIGTFLAKIDTGIIYPHSEMNIYSGNLDKHLSRTLSTNTQNLLAVLWWFAAILTALLQKDKTTLVTGLIIGGGFGIGFMQSAMWTLGYVSAPKFVDWWKVWELNSGFNLGILYAITFYWYARKKAKEQHVEQKVAELKTAMRNREWINTILLAIPGFILTFIAGFEYFFWTGMGLGLFYLVTMLLTPLGTTDSFLIKERRKNVLLIYSIFLLVFMMFHGASERMGIFFGLYAEDAVAQYSWPLARIIIFIPFVALIFGVSVYRMWQVLRPGAHVYDWQNISSRKSLQIVDLMTVMGFVGAVSIWPHKIGVFYAIFLCMAVWSFLRINSYYLKK